LKQEFYLYLRMRVLLLICVLSCGWLCHTIAAAPVMSQSDRQELELLQNALLRSNGVVSKQLEAAYPIYNLDGRWYLSMLGRCSATFKPEELQWQRILFNKPIAGLLSLKVPLQKLGSLATLKSIDYLEIAGKINPNLDKAILDLHADSVHA
ncbi:MAG: hypothetical protein ACKOSR_09750, partial [Flavobacteriales bacterium]